MALRYQVKGGGHTSQEEAYEPLGFVDACGRSSS